MARCSWLLVLLGLLGACRGGSGPAFSGLELDVATPETPDLSDASPAEPDAPDDAWKPAEAEAHDGGLSDLPADLSSDASAEEERDAPLAEPDLDANGEPGPETDAASDLPADPEEADLVAPDTVDVAAPDAPDVEPPPDCGGPCVPLVTEFMAENTRTLLDADGDPSDWIELYNPTGIELELGGFHLTDDPAVPARWTFPDVRLAPQAYLLVFASAKDRVDPSSELHANFKLAREGEYLALVSPALDVIQAFVDVPPQVADVAYGAAVSVTRTALVSTGAAARYRAPAAPLSDDWTAVGFDDGGSEWSAGLTGLGFDVSPGPEVPPSPDELGPPLADSVADWSADGVQGENGWTYGYFDRSATPDGVYTTDAFVPFPRDGSGYGAADFWNGTRYDWFAGDPPWTAVGADYAHPSGANNGVEHWPIRRYVAASGGPFYVQWRVAKAGAGGHGVTAIVFHQGVQVDTATVAGDDTLGVTRTVVLPSVAIGDVLDVALTPTGPGGEPDDASDGSVLAAALWGLPNLADHLATDVGAEVAGLGTTLCVRLPFDAEAPETLNRLDLRVRYDDGFAAWLNGQPLAAANAPAPPTFDATALTDRPASAAVTLEGFDVHDGLPLLQPGPNVLALLALNSAVDDPTLLVSPELEGRRIAYDASASRYYDRPTPGTDNDDGPATIGPIVEHRTPPGALPPDQDLVVSARVLPTSAAVASVELVTRVMFGPETSLPMADAGEGVFTATIPAGTAAPGEMIRWHLVATDAAGLATRAPVFDLPTDSEASYGTIVDDPAVVSNLPVFHWFVENPAAAATWGGARGSLFYAGEFYDNVRFDLHGQSTSGFPKKSYDVDFPSDHRFLLSPGLRRMKDLNLLNSWADKTKVRNTLAWETARNTGAGYHLAFPVRVQRNAAFFELADFVEDGDDRWIERLGLDPAGALYKVYDGLWDSAKGEKKTRKTEDASDLQAFIDGLDQTGPELRAFLYDHVNLAAMATFYATLTLLANTDCCHKNFYAYRDTNGSGEWRYLPWDLDLTFGHNWTPQKYYFEDALHPENPLFGGGGNKLTTALYAQPEFVDMYLRRLRTVIDALQQPPETPVAELKLEQRIDELVARIGGDAALDHDAWPIWGLDETMEQAVARLKTDYLAPRRTFLFQTMAAPAGPIPPAQEHPVVLVYDGDPSPAAPAEAYVVLLNPNPFAVDLSGWRLVGGVSILLQPGTVLPALGQLFVAADVTAFRARAEPPHGGQGLFVQGNYAGTLVDIATLLLLDEEGVPVSQAW